MDKIEVCLRLGENNFDALHIIQDTLSLYVERNEAFYLKPRHYGNIRYSLVVQIPLLPPDYPLSYNLIVESGSARDWHGSSRPYAKFCFNVEGLSTNERACRRFLEILQDIIPSGGYADLLEDGYVVYAEFSADFRGVEVESLDAYCPSLNQSLYNFRDGVRKTINLHDERPGRPEAFCIYDKKRADREQHHRIRRGPLVRIEAKRRFNRTPNYRELHLNELHRIRNPFESLRIYDRNRIEQTFTAARHRNFLEQFQREGVQAALTGTRGADRDRRERMLDTCKVDWWNPEQAWAGKNNAILKGLLL